VTVVLVYLLKMVLRVATQYESSYLATLPAPCCVLQYEESYVPCQANGAVSDVDELTQADVPQVAETRPLAPFEAASALTAAWARRDAAASFVWAMRLRPGSGSRKGSGRSM